ncbi:MAG: 2-phosphosulfolactate phosphatase [Tissierellales bacterium]|jgi:2-phosphosulfolactate phosphatase|nr:2-phosphosulfolactate phosphatase [Tissierellales bacterium]
MEIKRLHLIEGAKNARGLVVIIDVFRAFTTACYLIGQGADKIIPRGEIESVWEAKKIYPDAITIGERDGDILPGFDYGNSPHRLRGIDFKGKVIIQTTSAGTQGIVNAVNADEIITGSFVNAGAICRYIKEQKPKTVSLVAMGYAGELITMEDEYFAEYLAARLEDEDYSMAEKIELLKKGDGARFFDENSQNWSPKEDFELCLEIDQFDFILKLEEDSAGICLKKIKC